MTTHTPGPWEAIDRDGIGIDDNVIGPNNEQIARVYAIDTDSGNSNWQLITAAPALLEAAEAAVAALTWFEPSNTRFARSMTEKIITRYHLTGR